MNAVTGLKAAASVPLALALLILLLFAVGETASGDISGLSHLLFAVPMALLFWLGWRSPRWGGILLLALGVIAVLNFAEALSGPNALWPILIIIGPPVVSGLLLLVAAGLQRKAA